MAKNIYSLQLLRNSQIFQDKAAAIAGITGSTTQDGVIKLARYTEGTATKTIFGIYNDDTVGTSGYTIYDSYQEVIADIQERIASLESGSTEAIEEINKKLGSGVTSANTVTDQLEALSGDSSTAQSGDTSVEGAKKYTDGKIEALDYTDADVTGEYVSAVNEANGVISVTRVALPSVNAISEAGKPITAVSESLGEISATAGAINAEFVNVADSGNLFSGSTVEAVLAEIDAAYKAADDAIVGDATTSGDTLGKLEDRIEALDANAKEYSIKQITAGLSTNVKEAWGLFDADNNQSGATINIYKDSAYKEIYLGTSADTIDATTGEITKQKGDKQSLNYAYYKADGTYDLVKVDVSAFLSENEFASGVTATDHIVHGVVDTTSEKNSGDTASFLTVGEDGFKVDGIKQEIINRINELDATVGEASVATGNHVAVQVVEADGKLTAVTVREDNIANADDLAELSTKTVTEIASSNDSITVASGATTAADGTVKYDIITDASKIQMSGFTAAESGFTAIAESSSVTEAFKAVETYVLENEQVVSAALNDLETTKAEKTALDAEIAARKAVDGQNGDTYVANASAKYISGATSLNDADLKLDAAIANITTGFIEGVQVNGKDLPENNNKVNVQIEASDTSGEDGNKAIVITQDATSGKLTLALGTIDAGTY